MSRLYLKLRDRLESDKCRYHTKTMLLSWDWKRRPCMRILSLYREVFFNLLTINETNSDACLDCCSSWVKWTSFSCHTWRMFFFLFFFMCLVWHCISIPTLYRYYIGILLVNIDEPHTKRPKQPILQKVTLSESKETEYRSPPLFLFFYTFFFFSYPVLFLFEKSSDVSKLVFPL